MLFRMLFVILLLFPLKVVASQTITEGALIRDAEIEEILKSYISPLFDVAGLNPNTIRLYIIHSKEVNAFAMGGGRIAVTTGFLLKASSALQVIGVLAHETAHLAGNHVIRGAEAYERALLQGLLGTLGGVAAGLAGSPEAAVGILLGSQEFAKNSLLKFSRSQENAADQGATRFLDDLGYSSQGMLEFMQILRKDDIFSDQHLDPYASTHPLHSDRIDFFRSHLSRSPHAQKGLPRAFDNNFERLQVKLTAFTTSPYITLSRFESTDQSPLARYGRAIAHFQNSHVEDSLKEIDSLIQEFPSDPYFWELKGQILFETGKIKESAIAYERAVKFKPQSPLLRVSWAHSLIEGNDPRQLETAFLELLRAKTEEPQNPFTYRLLAVCYGKKEKVDLAALSLAEMALVVGDLEMAEQQAKRALHFLKNDPANHRQAKDILAEAKRLRESGEEVGF
ncbi:MAG: M48 family metalloprotease [Alphaproteobacteria bacterium]|nr:M48 family metalloprotease [Alphaproteobacteria bacterium]